MYYFHNSIKQYTICFGNLFNNFVIHNVDKSTNPPTIKEQRVPLNYSQKLHYWLKTYQKVPDDYNIATILPRVVFSLHAIEAAYEERGNSKFENVAGNPNLNAYTVSWLQNAVPYKFTFTISIWTKYEDHMNQLLEQILPFYVPARNVHIKEIPVLDVYRTCRISLGALASEYTNEFEAEGGDKVLQHSIDFTMDGYLYPPIETTKLPTRLIINLYDSFNNLEETYYFPENPIIPEIEGVYDGLISSMPVQITWTEHESTTYEATLTNIDTTTEVPYVAGTPISTNGNYKIRVVATKIANEIPYTSETEIEFSINIVPFIGPVTPFIGGATEGQIVDHDILLWTNQEYEDTTYSFTLNGNPIDTPHTTNSPDGVVTNYTVVSSATKDAITLTAILHFSVDKR